MKRIEHRSAIALLLAAALLLGMGFFVVRLALYGGDWASYSANQHILPKRRAQKQHID